MNAKIERGEDVASNMHRLRSADTNLEAIEESFAARHSDYKPRRAKSTVNVMSVEGSHQLQIECRQLSAAQWLVIDEEHGQFFFEGEGPIDQAYLDNLMTCPPLATSLPATATATVELKSVDKHGAARRKRLVAEHKKASAEASPLLSAILSCDVL